MRLVRVLGRIGSSVLVAASFVGASAAAVTLHAGTPAFRRAAAKIANDVLAGRFAGKVVVGDVEVLSLGRRTSVRARSVTVTDPEGREVLSAKNVEASLALDQLVSSLGAGGGAGPRVDVSNARIEDAEVILDAGASGKLRLAHAFDPRPSATPGKPAAAGAAPTSGPEVHIRAATIAHARVKGTPSPGAPIDARVDGVRARFDLADGRSHVLLDHADVTLESPQAPGQKAPIVAAATGTLEIGPGFPLRAEADVVGACAAVPLTAHAKINGDDLEATLEVPRTDPKALASAFADLPLRGDGAVDGYVHAQGKLPLLVIDARAHAGGSSATALATLALDGKRAFTIDVAAKHVDARSFGAEGATDLSAEARAEGTLGAEPLATSVAVFHVATTAGTASGQPIPPAVVDGRLEQKQLSATLKASEPGVDASGNATFDLSTLLATFDLRARSTSLRASTRITPPAGGSASAHVQGEVDVAARTIHASVDASADDFTIDAFAAKHVDAGGTFAGPLAAPVLDVQFRSTDMQLQAKGKEPLVYPEAAGRAKVAFAPTPRVFDASVRLHERGGPGVVSVSARSVSVVSGAVEASGLEVSGLGAPLELDVRGGGGLWNIRAKSDGLDLHRASRVTGIAALDLLPPGTRASVDVDVKQGVGGPNGHLDVILRASRVVGDGDLVAEAHATIERGTLTGNARIAADGFGQIEITRAELALPERMDGRSLARTTGTLELRGAVDLAQGAALFGGEHVERVDGIASFEGRIERGDPEALPVVRATVRTTGLEVVVASQDPAGGPPTSTTVAGVELLTHVAWDGKTEDAELALLSWDAHGLLGSAGAKARVPLAAWATGAKKLDVKALENLEVGAAADLPSRDLAALPAFLRVLGLRGNAEGRVRVSGTLAHPQVLVSADGQGIAGPSARGGTRDATLEPVDGTLDARWNGRHAVMTFGLTERPRERAPRRGPGPGPSRMPVAGSDASPGLAPERSRTTREPAYVHGLVLGEVEAADLLHGRSTDATLPWKASAQIEVQNVTLAALPLPGRMTGVLSGHARVSDLNTAPVFEAKVHVDGFGASGATIEAVDATVAAREASLSVKVTAADQTTSGKASIALTSEGLHVQGLDVSFDSQAKTRLDYMVENVRLALAAPMFRHSVSELDGLVDGSGSVTVDGTSQVFEGGIRVSGATLYANAIGEEISGLNAAARFDKTGAWTIDGASGKMGTGEFTAQASGRMRGLSLLDAEASINATKGGIPISSEAATFAEAVGQVKITAKQSDDQKSLVATVDIPSAKFSLPDRSPQKLEPLTEDTTVAIGVRRKNGELDTSAVRKSRRNGSGQPAANSAAGATTSPFVTRITVTLGKDVHLQGQGIDVSLGGQTLVQIADQLKVTGKIELHGGSIEVHGRRFTIDRGTVSFLEGGDPSNPTVIAAAYWDSPDGTKVWVEFAGPIKTGNLVLRSEPPFSKSEILSVLLFGRPDPNMAAAGDSQGGDTSGATAIGTGLVADDLNRVLSDIDENLDIETDTLEGNRARTKLGRTFFDRRLKVQVGYAPGVSYREPDTTYLFLNWQFIPKWSLVATRGNQGTSILDVLFQHRY